MNFLDLLNEELSNDNIEHHLFLIGYNPRNKVIHCFFEGKTDESFYGTLVRNMMPDTYKLKTYICGKKDSVIYHYNEIGHKTNNVQPLLFFIDKDIDDIIPIEVPKDENIHETIYYAIENYMVNGAAICQIWAEMFRQSSGTKISEKINNLFDNAHSEYNKIALRLMSWVLYHRRKGGVRLNLDCIQTNELFSINRNLELSPAFTDLELYSHLDSKTKVVTLPSDIEGINQCYDELSAYEIKTVSRGHNEMDFFIEFFKKLKEVSSEAKVKPQFDISSSNAIDVLGPRTKPCKLLLSFLTAHFSKLDVTAQTEQTA
ncbi:DUF4435 domain-containing protein [Vibrio diabolicus]|uniref:DUF4435 domain-containing protein n=1 Tax=Vibrio diabolicus TaxID=50719 RepID=UPI0037530682